MPIRLEFGIIKTTQSSLSPQLSDVESQTPKADGYSRPKLADFIQKPSNERVWLEYELLPGTFPETWLSIFLYEFERRNLWHFNFGSLFVNETHYRQKIATRLKSLRTQNVVPLSVEDKDIVPFIRRKTLEDLLADCAAILSGKHGDQVAKAAGKNADAISDLVRHYIQIYHPEYHYHISLQAYVAQEWRLPRDAYSNFTCDRKDGWLYLDYVGRGHDSLGAYNEKSIADHEPQALFSANSQILYRENFDGAALQNSARKWLKEQNQSQESVGLIPLAKPLHKLTRQQVRELFAQSDAMVSFRVSKDGQTLNSQSLQDLRRQVTPYYPHGQAQALGKWLLRTTLLDRPLNFLVDCHFRYVGSLWMIKKPYYWIKPKAFRAYFTLSWPIRILIYYFQYQISVGFIDYRTLAKVYAKRTWTAIQFPFHWLRPHAFDFYFAVSRPIRKTFYFLKFQFDKRIRGVKK